MSIHKATPEVVGYDYGVRTAVTTSRWCPVGTA